MRVANRDLYGVARQQRDANTLLLQDPVGVKVAHADSQFRSRQLGDGLHSGLAQRRKLAYRLHRRLGEVCTREEIISALYPDEPLDVTGGDNCIDSLMRHLRKAV